MILRPALLSLAFVAVVACSSSQTVEQDDDGDGGASGAKAGSGGTVAGKGGSGGTRDGVSGDGGTDGGGVAGEAGAPAGGSGGTAGDGAAGTGEGGTPGVAGSGGSGGTPPTGPCDLSKPFGTPTPLNLLNTTSEESGPFVTSDGLRIYFYRDSTMSFYTATRASVLVNFASATELNGSPTGGVSSGIAAPFVSQDGLRLYYSLGASSAPLGIYLRTRSSVTAAWNTTATSKLELPGAYAAGDPWLSADEQRLYYGGNADAASSFDIQVSTVTSTGYSTMTQVGGLASASLDSAPTLTADELTIYFTSDRAGTGTLGGRDIWTATRASSTAPFANLRPVTELNTSGLDVPGSVSPDGCVLYFHRAVSGRETDLFMARKPD